MPDATRPDELLALLAWWREAGVDVALDDTPIDWSRRGDIGPGNGFAWPAGSAAIQASADRSTTAPRPPEPTTRAQPTPATRAPPPPPRPTVAVPAVAPNRAAGEPAGHAKTLAELEAALRSFEGCALKATAKNLCFYRGNPHGRLMIIGEAPGREEDLEGRPFVGPAGQFLDRMLAAIGMTEADVHFTNVVYWRPPGNRTPTLEEVEACRPFLSRQIELVAPHLIMTLGGPAAKAMLGSTEGILRMRGKWGQITAGESTVRVMPTLHPAYLLRTPAAKRQAWRDLLAVKVALETGVGGNDP